MKSRTIRCFLLLGLSVSALDRAAAQTTSAPSHQQVVERLPPDERLLIRSLTERLMPELVEEMLRERPLANQSITASAYAHAGRMCQDEAEKHRLLEKAATWYRRLLTLAEQPGWINDESRRCQFVEWLLALADVLTRLDAAEHLDRYELTSGLDFDRERLAAALGEARALYDKARQHLDELDLIIRTDEERILLIGLTPQIHQMAVDRAMGAAWTDLYLGQIMDASAVQRNGLLISALAQFDTLSRDHRDITAKYTALLGAGIAARELARYEESAAALQRVIASTASWKVIARARMEYARCLLVSGQYDAARRELKSLAEIKNAEEEGDFYVRLAPVIAAYSYVVQSKSRVSESPEATRLEGDAQKAFEEITRTDARWGPIVDVYVQAMDTDPRDMETLNQDALRNYARRLVAKEAWAEAAKVLDRLVERFPLSPSGPEDRYRLADCKYRLGQIDAAAQEFAALAEMTQAGSTAELAAERAYLCRRELAGATQERQAYLALAASGDTLATRYPSNPQSAEAGWLAALAFEDVGELERAVAAYERISPESTHYGMARFAVARCRQNRYLTARTGAVPRERARLAREAITSWQTFLNELDLIRKSHPDECEEWAQSAREQAAALLVGDDAADYKAALALLEAARPTPSIHALKLVALQGVGDVIGAGRMIDAMLREAGLGPVPATLLKLAADQASRSMKLADSNRGGTAMAAVEDAVALHEKIIASSQGRLAAADAVRGLKLNLARLLPYLGRLDEAAVTLDMLIQEDPVNGDMVYLAAGIQERIAEQRSGNDQTKAQENAEAYWSRLLADSTLRETAPGRYWEARYRWLVHQYRKGRAAEVVKAITAERAWYPELGGPPWQSRLIDLAEQAAERVPDTQGASTGTEPFTVSHPARNAAKSIGYWLLPLTAALAILWLLLRRTARIGVGPRLSRGRSSASVLAKARTTDWLVDADSSARGAGAEEEKT